MTKFIKTVEALAGVALVSIYAVIFVKVMGIIFLEITIIM